MVRPLRILIGFRDQKCRSNLRNLNRTTIAAESVRSRTSRPASLVCPMASMSSVWRLAAVGFPRSVPALSDRVRSIGPPLVVEMVFTRYIRDPLSAPGFARLARLRFIAFSSWRSFAFVTCIPLTRRATFLVGRTRLVQGQSRGPVIVAFRPVLSKSNEPSIPTPTAKSMVSPFMI